MKKNIKIYYLLFIVILFTACSKQIDDSIVDVDTETPLGTDAGNLILEIDLIEVDGTPLIPAYKNIDQENRSITITFPFDTELSALTTQISISEEAELNITDDTVLDFSKLQEIVVTSVNGIKKTYQVAVDTPAMSQKDALWSFDLGSNNEEYGWDYDTDISTWEGIEVVDGNVITINLGNNYNGLLELNNNLGHLIYLEKIILVENGSPLPDEIAGNLENLKNIDLELTGSYESLPMWVGNLPNLTSLTLNESYIKLNSTDVNYTKLESFNFFLAQFSDDLLNEILNIKSIKNLTLQEISLNEIPTTLINLPLLESLNFSHNNLTPDSFPDNFADFEIKTLNISNNEALTELPDSICTLIEKGTDVVTDIIDGCSL